MSSVVSPPSSGMEVGLRKPKKRKKNRPRTDVKVRKKPTQPRAPQRARDAPIKMGTTPCDLARNPNEKQHGGRAADRLVSAIKNPPLRFAACGISYQIAGGLLRQCTQPTTATPGGSATLKEIKFEPNVSQRTLADPRRPPELLRRRGTAPA